MDFELTRFENDEKLLPQLAAIKTAENIQVLIPFAKAYLGMFYVIEKELPEKEKVKLLANNELAEAIFDGFLSSLNLNELPSIENIGAAIAEKKEFQEGYVILAGLDLVAKNSLEDIPKLDEGIVEKGIGFHFSNNSGYHDIWFDYLLAEHKHRVVSALSKYWVAMLKNKVTYLPGKNLVLGDKPDVEITQSCILPMLNNWHNCKEKTLVQLLHLAFKFSEKNEFLTVCEQALKNDTNLNERTRLYWITSAYLMSPEKYFARLSNYVGRVKLKVMPLLDFVILIMKDEGRVNIKLDAKIIVQLLRMIAPIFPPQHHVYGALGALDINSKNVLLMFYFLVSTKDTDATNEIKSLRKARVMKIYSAVIDDLLELRIRQQNSAEYSIPNFNEYVDLLIKKKYLHSRSNKFDLR